MIRFLDSLTTTSHWSAICPLLLAVCIIAGCGGDSGTRTFTDDDDVENVDPIESHDHAHAPHDGLYAVFGAEEYHGELVFSDETGEVTVYILGPDGQTPHPISDPEVIVRIDLSEGEHVELTLPAVPDASDPEGQSSRFTQSSVAGPHQIETADAVSIIASIDGEEYTGDVLRDAHAHEHSHEGGEEAHDHAQEDGDESYEHAHEDGEESHEHSHEEPESSSSQ